MPAIQTQSISPAERLSNLRYAIRDLAVAADAVVQQGHKVLYLNVGDPNIFDFVTPPHVVEAACRAMRDNKNGYAPSQGIPPALDYPLYSAVLAKTGAELNSYFLNEEDGWQPDLDDLKKKINPRTRGIVLINPNNPTGAICTRPMLEHIAELARQHNLLIIADEIYDKLILDGSELVSIAEVAPDLPIVTLGGLSKNYLAPGWRVGWGIVSGDAAAVKPYAEGVHKLLRP